MMRKMLQRLAIWFYEKMDCRGMDRNAFWQYHLLYSVPKIADSKIVVAEINRITNEIEYRGEWTHDWGFKE